jgi:hypothetical protein
MSAHAGPTDMLSEVQDIELHAMKEGGAILLERVQEACTLVLLNCVKNCLLIGLMNDIYVADICWRVSRAILSESRFAHTLYVAGDFYLSLSRFSVVVDSQTTISIWIRGASKPCLA